MSVLAAIAVLALLIVIHELGHFSAARLQNIHVNRFSIGFGPTLLKYQGKETEYAIRAFPLGGYVGFPDDDPDSDIPPEDPDLLRNRPIFDRAIVISAGVIANLIFAYFLLVTQAGTVGFQDIDYQPGVRIPDVLTAVASPAAQAGIQSEDVVLSVNNTPLSTGQDALEELRDLIQDAPGKSLTLQILRDSETVSVEVTPDAGNDGKGKIGVMLAPNGEIVRRRAENPVAALQAGSREFQRLIGLTVQGFAQLISNFGETAQQVAGPVAIVAVGADLAKDDLSNLFQFGSLISINLAIINILPLPALDGGQLAFLLVEGLRGRPLPMRIQENIMQTGLVLLLGLGVFLIVRDTVNLAFFQNLMR
ncbi:RIP metalloprotease RseP [[Limnothrix rosea] IAM M-220]|uniref:RIP metalloprotease RseP n=1 Tax=[Limnothrix rosea] IAM M-220 TaxID=454133 RepID=UPI00095DA149|nr:RIP metalloprotease RseP [[Limnothrix rosea] IAM M-220]OKH16946.1 RIP metalloprotease RseP [[Limnothrix rosea] IAM M-220]